MAPVLTQAGAYYSVGFSGGIATSAGSTSAAAGPNKQQQAGARPRNSVCRPWVPRAKTIPFRPRNRPSLSALTRHAKIPMGSATKLYTATALLRLQELGVLDLDRTAASIVDPFLRRTNGTSLAELWGTDAVNRITVRQLASMRSGLADYDDEGLQQWSLDPANLATDISPYDYLHRWAQKQLLFPPGKGAAYSSIGFVVLGFVLAATTNQTAWTGFDQRMIIPAPLKHDPVLNGLIFNLGGTCSSMHASVSHQYAQQESIEPGTNWRTVTFEDLYDGSCLNGE